MMKKLLVMLLAAALLLCGAAMAEEAAGTRFFGGLYMGMSPEEVENALGLDFDYRNDTGELVMCLIAESVVDGVDCQALAVFHNDRLCIISIGVFADPEDIDVLKEALTAECGAPSTDDIPYLVDKYTSNSGVTITAGWRPAPDVYATIIDAYGDEAVYFFDPSIDFWALENGLEPETAPVETETAAPAEPTAVPAIPAFTFRGLTWGMTPAEVEAVEGQEFGEVVNFSYTLSYGLLEDRRVSKFHALMGYVFAEDALAGVDITIYDTEESYAEDAEYLVQALTQLYGEPLVGKEALPETLRQLNQFGDEHTYFHVWLPTEDTCIYLYRLDVAKRVSLGYYDVSLDWLYHYTTTAPIDTTGL